LKEVIVVLILVVILSFSFVAEARKVQTHIISFPDDPVDIQAANAWVPLDRTRRDKLVCELTAMVENKPIKATEFIFIFFDVFDGHLDNFRAVIIEEMKPGKQFYFEAESYFYNYWTSYTAIVFLNRVRFSDGTIWRQDKERVAEEIAKTTRVLFKKEQLEKIRKK